MDPHFMSFSELSILMMIVINGLSGCFSGTVVFGEGLDRLLDEEDRKYLELKIHELSLKLGIKKKLWLLGVRRMPGVAKALGTTLLPGRSGIMVNPDSIVDFTKGELEFLVAHELAHIRANDHLWLTLVPAAGFIVISYINQPFMSFLVYLLSFGVLSRWRERLADRLAISLCSDQIGALTFFERLKYRNLLRRNDGSFFGKILTTKKGDNRINFIHSPLTSRLNFLRSYSKKSA